MLRVVLVFYNWEIFLKSRIRTLLNVPLNVYPTNQKSYAFYRLKARF